MKVELPLQTADKLVTKCHVCWTILLYSSTGFFGVINYSATISNGCPVPFNHCSDSSLFVSSLETIDDEIQFNCLLKNSMSVLRKTNIMMWILNLSLFYLIVFFLIFSFPTSIIMFYSITT